VTNVQLRRELRENSQGLPWSFKKLANHLIREVGEAATQEQLLAETLNVQSLFEADLAVLNPQEGHAVLEEYVAGPLVTARCVTASASARAALAPGSMSWAATPRRRRFRSYTAKTTTPGQQP
jgi:hypothetical protein